MIIKLDSPTECDKLCKLVQRIIAKHEKQTGLPAQALAINVVEIIDQAMEQKCLTDES